MADTDGKIRDFLGSSPTLDNGETYLASVKAMPAGGIKKFAKDRSVFLVGGAVGALIAHARDKRIDADDLATSMRNGVFLAATDRRLLLISCVGLRSQPQELLASVERARIVQVERGETRVSMVKMMTATFHFDDGTNLGFEFPKVDTKDANSLLQSFGA
jgi:hypothetical protein